MRKVHKTTTHYKMLLKQGFLSLLAATALIFAVCLPANTAPVTISVPSGTNVQVDPIPEMSIIFPQVSGGELTVDDIPNPDLPTNYRHLGGSVYSVNFTGTFTGNPKVCISYDENMVFNESNLKFLRHTGTDWITLTSYPNTVANNVCAYPVALTTFAIAEIVPVGFSKIYFPSMYDGFIGWRNYITVQGINSRKIVNLKAYFYDPDGRLATPDKGLCPTCTNPAVAYLSPNRKYNVTPNWALYKMLENKLFEGTVVVEADNPVIGMANALGPNSEAFNIYESAKARTDLVFSKISDGKMANGGKWLTWVCQLQLQNVEDTDVVTDITFSDPGGAFVKKLTDVVIPAHGKFEIRPSAATGYVPFLGSAHVATTGGRLAGMMKYMYGQGSQLESFTIYEANELRTSAYFPRIYDTLNTGDKNYITAINVNTFPVSLTLKFYKDYGLETTGLPYFQQDMVLGRNQQMTTTPTYLFCGQLNCTGFAGSLTMSADGPIYGTTNTVSASPEDPREAFNIYEATVPAQKILFPKVNDGYNGWVNEAVIFNIDSVPRTISIIFYNPNGTTLGVVSRTLPAYGQYKFSPRVLLGAPFRSALEVTANVPGVITGVMRYEYNGGPNVRAMTIYEGIAKP